EIFEDKIYTHDRIAYREGAVVLDVGANIGMFSLFISQAIPTAKIYAFEPVAPIRERLERNVRRYARDASIMPFGLSDNEREETFPYYPRYSMMSGLQVYADAEAEKRVVKRYLGNAARNGDASAQFLLDNIEDALDGRFEGRPQQCLLRRLSDFIDERN